MRAFWNMTVAEFKANLRNPVFIIFTIFLPLLLILLFNGLYGNTPNHIFMIGAISESTPAYLALAIAIISLTGLPTQIVGYKENKVLKRLNGTPISKAQIFVPILLNYVLLFLIGMVLLLLAGRVLQNVSVAPGHVPAFTLAVLLSVSSHFSFGVLLSCLCTNVKQATGIGFTILIPVIFLSGATMPISAFPNAMGSIAKAVPLNACVTFLQNTFLGKPFADSVTPLIVLAVMTVVCVLLSLKLFRWE